MAVNESRKSMDSKPRSPHEQESFPAGYRSGVITAITVMLGFSLLFLRSWAFELLGEWTTSSVTAAILLFIATVLELIALWRSLQPEDELLKEYRLTLRWFLASTVFLLLSLIIAAFSYADIKARIHLAAPRLMRVVLLVYAGE
jgi:hypothetical protein